MAIGVTAIGATAIGAAPAYIVRVGPSFALVVPTQYSVHAPAPENALHPQQSGHDSVGAGTEVVLALIVFLIVAGQVVVRIIRENVSWPGEPIP